MAKNAKLTPVAQLPELDIFSKAPRQLAIAKDLVTFHRPLNATSADTPLIFEITTGYDEYLRMKETELFLRFSIKIEKASGAVTAGDWDNISPVNNLLHSFIKTLKIYIGGNEITIDHQNYAYKAYLETLLGFTNDAKKSHLQAAGWFEDDASSMDNPVPARWFGCKPTTPANAAEFEVCGKILTDLTYQPRALLGGTNLKIEIVPHDPSFYFFSKYSSLKPKVELKDAFIKAHRSKLSPMMLEAHKYALEKFGSCIYPLTRMEVRSFIIPANSLSFHRDNIVHGLLPTRMWIVFTDNDAFNGSYQKNPFNFKNFGLKTLSVFKNGIEYPPKGFNTNFSTKDCKGAFLAFNEVLHQDNTDAICALSYEDWMNGHTIFAVDFRADLGDGPGYGGCVEPDEHGVIAIEGSLASTNSSAFNMTIFCEYVYEMKIDAARQAKIEQAQPWHNPA